MSRTGAELEAEARPRSARRARTGPRTRRSSIGELAVNGAQLAGLSAFALSQPLFDLLSRNAEFFAVRGSTSGDIVLFALLVTVVPPLAMLAVEALAGLVDRRLRLGLHLVFVAALVGLFAAQALKRIDGLGSLPILVGAALLAVAAAIAYLRLEPVRRLLTILAPASLLFPALFLFSSPVTKLVFPPTPQVAQAAAGSGSEAPPIVFVILDEFPTPAIMTSSGEIDSVRYPNIAAFARGATWFRNATTVGWETVHAVPSLLTGRLPESDQLPVFADHPRNLFTLLRGRYRLNVHESNTRLCPRDLCESETDAFGERMRSLFSDVGVLYAHMVAPPRYERRLPSVATGGGDFLADDDDPRERKGKLARWRAFVASVGATGRPTLDFIHILLPHEPWKFLPSCRSNVFRTVRIHTPGLPPGDLRWQPDSWLTTQAHQRLLLQAQCIDSLVGRLMRKLQELGRYDDSLVVLASDHGVSVRPGQLRRHIDPDSPTNLADLAFPVVIVKRPGQQRGEV
ncbi:MAG: sulfatase-like hydrolase/transferase, partial [Gaiellaceae bacterium]